jgi:hypothetical protein
MQYNWKPAEPRTRLQTACSCSVAGDIRTPLFLHMKRTPFCAVLQRPTVMNRRCLRQSKLREGTNHAFSARLKRKKSAHAWIKPRNFPRHLKIIFVFLKTLEILSCRKGILSAPNNSRVSRAEYNNTV